MEDIMNLQKSGIINDETVRTKINGNKLSPEKTINNPVLDNLITEGGEIFFHYLYRLGLANEQNLLILSSRHHYYYDYNDLKGVTTVINLTKLNLIRHLDSFLYTVSRVLSPGTNFIGCFSDRKNKKEITLNSRMCRRFINFLDSRTDIEIDRKDVSKLLESHGFKVVDMTEINGLTYYRARNNGKMFQNKINR